jgi:hypothetical protein
MTEVLSSGKVTGGGALTVSAGAGASGKAVVCAGFSYCHHQIPTPAMAPATIIKMIINIFLFIFLVLYWVEVA